MASRSSAERARNRARLAQRQRRMLGAERRNMRAARPHAEPFPEAALERYTRMLVEHVTAIYASARAAITPHLAAWSRIYSKPKRTDAALDNGYHGPRIAIVGPPRAGKSTLSEQLATMLRAPVVHADHYAYLGWSQASDALADRMLAGPAIFEGVAVSRALRKVLARTPRSARPPVDAVIVLGTPLEPLEHGQRIMALGHDRVLSEVLPELARRGVTIIRGERNALASMRQARTDAEKQPPNTPSGLIDGAAVTLPVDFKIPDIRAGSLEAAVGVSVNVDNTLRRQIESVTGIDPHLPQSGIAEALEEFTEASILRVRNLTDETYANIKKLVMTELEEGARPDEIAAKLQSQFEVAKRHAQLIANDAVGKYHGAQTQLRQTQLGITDYTWATSKDRKVRPYHRALEGTQQKWAEPPVVNPTTGKRAHPGFDTHFYACRCSAIPVIDDAVIDAEPPAPAPATPPSASPLARPLPPPLAPVPPQQLPLPGMPAGPSSGPITAPPRRRIRIQPRGAAPTQPTQPTLPGLPTAPPAPPRAAPPLPTPTPAPTPLPTLPVEPPPAPLPRPLPGIVEPPAPLPRPAPTPLPTLPVEPPAPLPRTRPQPGIFEPPAPLPRVEPPAPPAAPPAAPAAIPPAIAITPEEREQLATELATAIDQLLRALDDGSATRALVAAWYERETLAKSGLFGDPGPVQVDTIELKAKLNRAGNVYGDFDLRTRHVRLVKSRTQNALAALRDIAAGDEPQRDGLAGLKTIFHETAHGYGPTMRYETLGATRLFYDEIATEVTARGFVASLAGVELEALPTQHILALPKQTAEGWTFAPFRSYDRMIAAMLQAITDNTALTAAEARAQLLEGALDWKSRSDVPATAQAIADEFWISMRKLTDEQRVAIKSQLRNPKAATKAVQFIPHD
jgi:SPP1 gp7 family putative phage head morphogenesis protein